MNVVFDVKKRWLGRCRSIRRSDAAVFYWETDTPTIEICDAYGIDHPTRLSYHCGPAILMDELCKYCSSEVAVFSRTDAQERLAKKEGERGSFFSGHVCRECQLRDQLDRERQWRERHAAEIERQRLLRSMPYQEYLTTPEWKDRADRAKRSVCFRCQMCSGQGQLHVHHRTYARRGQEWNRDLIVLCADCHRLFHENRRLAEGGRAA